MSETELVCLRLLLETLLAKGRSKDAKVWARKLLVYLEGLSVADVIDGPPPSYAVES